MEVRDSKLLDALAFIALALRRPGIALAYILAGGRLVRVGYRAGWENAKQAEAEAEAEAQQ